MYTIEIPFLNLSKMYNSGSVFSWTQIDLDTYFIVDGSWATSIREIDEDKYQLSCSEDQWKEHWYNYFDMDTDYNSFWNTAMQTVIANFLPVYLMKALGYGYGIRILRQDSWQTIITFMISQNNNMKRIRKSVDMLKKDYGFKVNNVYNQYYFPTCLQLVDACFEDCGCGYRSEYLRDLCGFFYEYDLDNIFINDMHTMKTYELLAALKHFKGCGDKVTNCIALFGFHRLECAPIDVHMKKIIEEYFNRENPLEYFHGYEGWIQQCMFDYQTNCKS